ncbi:hypothetical protein EJB05_49968, partial [Eragrostis curvula]
MADLSSLSGTGWSDPLSALSPHDPADSFGHGTAAPSSGRVPPTSGRRIWGFHPVHRLPCSVNGS